MRNVKRNLLFLALLVIGIIIGAAGSSIYWIKFFGTYTELMGSNNISDLTNFALKICETGNSNSCIVALNYSANKLEMYQRIITPKDPNYTGLNIDLALTYARIGVLYEKDGKHDLAEQEYQKALRLVPKKWNMNSEKQLKDMIEKIDRNAHLVGLP